MPNRSISGENNRANEGNQSSRHHHSRGKTIDEKKITHRRSGIRMNQPSSAHEYYPQFDQTGKGVNPSKPIKRH